MLGTTGTRTDGHVHNPQARPAKPDPLSTMSGMEPSSHCLACSLPAFHPPATILVPEPASKQVSTTSVRLFHHSIQQFSRYLSPYPLPPIFPPGFLCHCHHHSLRAPQPHHRDYSHPINLNLQSNSKKNLLIQDPNQDLHHPLISRLNRGGCGGPRERTHHRHEKKNN